MPEKPTILPTPKQMQVLRMLMIGSGQVVKRGSYWLKSGMTVRIQATLWMSYIQRPAGAKMEINAEKPHHIISVRGSGYKFIGK